MLTMLLYLVIRKQRPEFMPNTLKIEQLLVSCILKKKTVVATLQYLKA